MSKNMKIVLITIILIFIIETPIALIMYKNINRKIEDTKTNCIAGLFKVIEVPVANKTIQPRTEITRDMITTILVPASIISENKAIKNVSQLIGKYTNVNSLIPEGGMFYKQSVVERSKLPDSAFTEVKDGEIPVQFRVDMESTYGNSILPGEKIDLYMKIKNKKIEIGKLFENIEVLAVKDAQGRHVFENTEEDRKPAYILFGLRQEHFILFTKAQYMEPLGVELILVPHGGGVSSDGEMKVSTQYLVDYINSNAATIYSDDFTIDKIN